MIEITVYGSPAPQGSKKFVGTTASGRGLMVESSKAVKPWREAVKMSALAAMNGRAGQGITGPVEVEMYFTMPKPKSAPRRMRTWADRKPDLSKLVRSTEDALVDVGTLEDDARIVSCLAMKVFPGEHARALSVPGVFILLRAAA